MARIIGGVASTHVPAIGKAIAEKKQNDPYWKPFFQGFDYVHDWLAREKPDVAVIFYNDQGSTSSSTSCPRLRSARRPSTAARTRAGASRWRARWRATRRSPGT